MTPAKLFDPDPGRGLTPSNFFDPDPGRGLTPAGVDPAGVGVFRGKTPDPGQHWKKPKKVPVKQFFHP